MKSYDYNIHKNKKIKKIYNKKIKVVSNLKMKSYIKINQKTVKKCIFTIIKRVNILL